MQRRNFLKLSGIAGGGLLLSTSLPFSELIAKANNGVWEPNFFIRITSDNVVTLISTQSEIGQGTTVGMSQIIADELGVDWKNLKLEFADGDRKKYDQLQGTGGSNGLRLMWMPLRKAGAATRFVLRQAAADRWKIDAEKCIVKNSRVFHSDGKQKLTFGELAEEASKLKLPEDPDLLPDSKFIWIGKGIAGHKQKAIVTGQQTYSLDLKLPNMAYAVIERSPVPEGTIKSFDATATRKVKGVIDVFQIDGNPRENIVFEGGVRQGVVVVATSTWAAIQGKRKLKVKWDDGEISQQGSDTSLAHFVAEVEKDHEPGTTKGDAKAELAKAKTTIKAQYVNDFQVNACMEPLNAIADYREDGIELWAGTQAPQLNRERIAKVFELEEEKVTVHNYPSGGGFGRRYYCDYLEEATYVSRQIKKPVKLMWTREDTIQTNRYHSFRLEQWESALVDKKWTGFHYKGAIVQPSAYRPFPYDIPNIIHEGLPSRRPYLNLYTSWRSVAAHFWVWGIESHIDELAYAAAVDPVKFRMDHLNENKTDEQSESTEDIGSPSRRLKAALNLLAEKGNWGRKMPKGSGQGVACATYNGSHCALLVEVSVSKNQFKIDKAIATIDCGKAINPSQVKAQIEGSVVWGMSALTQKIEIVNGRTKQTNFHNYPLPKNSEVPDVEVHIVQNDFGPTGTGEPGVPVVAPAVANAIFASTGKRLRRIPFDLSEVS